jgi:hypothetical protein
MLALYMWGIHLLRNIPSSPHVPEGCMLFTTAWFASLSSRRLCNVNTACSRRSSNEVFMNRCQNRKLIDAQGLRSSTTHMFMITVMPSQLRMESCVLLSLWHKIPSKRTRSRFKYEKPVGSAAAGETIPWFVPGDTTDFPKFIRGRKISRSWSNSVPSSQMTLR